MDQSNNVHLRWNKHQTTLVSVFDGLLNSEKLTDCTISAEGRQLKAHKVILSACSPYFEELFSENYEKHPIIILHDVKYDILKALMDFMYRGEVAVHHEKLSGVLTLSESLQVKGLSHGGCGDRVNVQNGSGRNVPPLAPTTLPSLSASVACYTSGQNETEGKLQSFRECSPATSDQERDSLGVDAIPKSKGKYRKSISHSGPDQTTDQNAFEEVITPDRDSVLEHPSQRQVMAVTCSSTDERGLNPIHSKSVSSELKSPSGELAVAENEQFLTPEAVLPDKRSAHLSAHQQEVSLETKTEVLDSQMEIVEDLTLDDDDDDDDYYCDDIYRNDANSAEGGTGTGRRASEGHTYEENFHLQGIDSPHSPFDNSYLRNSTLSAPFTISSNRFNCPVCEKSYLYRSGLHRHLKHECGKEPQFVCPRCNKRCARSDQLRAHMLSRRCRMKNSVGYLEGNG